MLAHQSRGISTVLLCADRASSNRKTGDMIQAYHLRSSGLACPTRCPYCYLLPWQGERHARKHIGDIPKLPTEPFGKPIRFGAGGDPGYLPLRVIRSLRSLADDEHTGYTKRWRIRPDLAGLLQASVTSLGEARDAWRKGFGTFRILRPTERPAIQYGERLCTPPCSTCLACNGTERRATYVHGSRKGAFV